MTIAEFIKELETKSSEANVLDKEIISIGTGMNTTDNYYVVKTKEKAIEIVYQSCK